ncbi:MAG: 30S ribosomal protein S9 [Dehalococcoidia bacterium]|nr:30S ribosomal protein S9 [Dehalococcoidia bacterium]
MSEETINEAEPNQEAFEPAQPVVHPATSSTTRRRGEAKRVQYIWATGRRKSAIAQVRLTPGNGDILINDKPFREFFPRLKYQQTVESPLVAINSLDKYHITVKVKGGGMSGQAGAICLGIARVLSKENELFKPALRGEKLLTRDSRIVERKKYGLRGARRAPQYTKR